MDGAYFSAFAALAGSAVGALGGIATTWITLNGHERSRRYARETYRKENLYTHFIEEASNVYSDALGHQLEDISKLVRLYAFMSKLRLFASDEVMEMAETVMRRIIVTYERPEQDVHALIRGATHEIDVLRPFSEACRKDMRL